MKISNSKKELARIISENGGWGSLGEFLSQYHILSSEEYFHLYPEQDAKNEFCESVTRSIPELEAKPSIERLATDYRNRKDYAYRKQQEADAAKADAEAKLAELVAAGKAIGLVVSVANIEPGLVITDWRDLREGDEIVSYYCPCVVVSVGDSEVTLRNRMGSTKNVNLENGVWTFIRRP